MKAFTFEVMKKIVISVDAESYMDAFNTANLELSDGSYDQSWHEAEPELLNTHVGNTNEVLT